MIHLFVFMPVKKASHGVATINRLLEIIGLFGKRALQKRLYSAKETYDFNLTKVSMAVRSLLTAIETFVRLKS